MKIFSHKPFFFLLFLPLFVHSIFAQQLPNGQYIITLAVSGLALDAAPNTYNQNGGKVQLWQKNGGITQIWTITNIPFTYDYQIVLTSSGLALDAASETFKQNGGKVQLWQSNKGVTQKWTIKPLYNGTFHIFLPKTSKGLDADYADISKNGCKIQLWDKNEKNKDQIWKLTPVAVAPTSATISIYNKAGCNAAANCTGGLSFRLSPLTLTGNIGKNTTVTGLIGSGHIESNCCIWSYNYLGESLRLGVWKLEIQMQGNWVFVANIELTSGNNVLRICSDALNLGCKKDIFKYPCDK